MQNSSSASRGKRRTADWAMMAGEGLFKGGQAGRKARFWGKKKQPDVQAAFSCGRSSFAAYSAAGAAASLAAVLPKRLRNFSTRPPMLSTDFCVPV